MQPGHIHPLATNDQAGLAELHTLLRELLGGRPVFGSLMEEQQLPSLHGQAFRLRFGSGGQAQSVVTRRLEPAIAQRNELVVRRWLPDAGLSDFGPTLRGVAAARNARCVWHVYEDLGDGALIPDPPDRRRVNAAVQSIARVHTTFADHPLLPECRLYGRDFGRDFFSTNIRDALLNLASLRSPRVDLSADHSALRDRLLARLCQLQEEEWRRARVFAASGGPETLLHGELRTINLLVDPASRGLQARLIDWDCVGVGPVSYDLSTFLPCFAPAERGWILESYRAAVAKAGWRLPGIEDLNLLFETAELARYAHMIIWPAIAIWRDRADWGWQRLAEIERCFENLQPVLPEDARTRSRGHGEVDFHAPPPGPARRAGGRQRLAAVVL